MLPIDTIQSLRSKVNLELAALEHRLGEKTPLRDAVTYTLCSEGKRYRPIIVLLVAEALEKNQDVVPAALSVEFFHSASLIADDLPCMDNASMRRGKPTTHTLYGQSAALLASYTLISLGYEYVAKNTSLIQKTDPSFAEVGLLAMETVTNAAGIFGATSGQFFDLFSPDSSLETLEKIVYQKTVTLFEISFVLGWLFGGGDKNLIDQVKSLAYHMGMAFQIADDLDDLQEDLLKETDTMVSVMGIEKSEERFLQETASYRAILKNLKIETAPLIFLIEMLEEAFFSSRKKLSSNMYL